MADIDIVTVVKPGLRRRQSTTHSQQEEGPDRDDMTKPVDLAPGDVLDGTGFKVRDFEDLWSRRKGLDQPFNASDPSYPTLPKIKLSSEDVTRWKMAWRAVPAFPKIGTRDETSFPAVLAVRIRDGPKMRALFKEFSVALSFGTAASIYGGLHALAWSSNFSSSTEQTLWRVSACVVMGGIPAGFFLFLLFDQRKRKLSEDDRPFLEGLFLITQVYLAGLALVAVVATYVGARAYLVAECFINLSHLSAEVFDIPSWTGYFPHIS